MFALRQLHAREWELLDGSPDEADFAAGGGDEAGRRFAEAGVPCALPLPRRGHSASVVNGRLLVFGGCKGLCTYLDDLWASDGSHWQRIDPRGECPTARAWHTATVCSESMLLLIGGRDAEVCI